jgi:putative salt-induced outer membrane protein YdiY
MRGYLQIPPLLLALVLASTTAMADELQLRNGDRLTGTTVSLASGTLTFSTTYGSVRVPWGDVVSLTIDAPILVTAGGQTRLQQGGAILVNGVTALALPQSPLTVDGGANAGFVRAGGHTDVNTLRLDADVLARAGDNRFTAAGLVNRAEDRGVETARNWSSTFKYDRFLTDRLFVNGNTIFTSDRFRDLDLRTALGVGLGYQVLTTPRLTLTADGGLGHVSENLDSLPDDSYSALRESATLGLILVPTRIQFFHQHDGYFGVSGDDNLFVKMQNGVRVGLAAGFVATLRHDLDYDRSPVPGRKTTDRTLSLTLGYRF